MSEHFLVRDAIAERNWLIQQQERINFEIEALTRKFHEYGQRIDLLDNVLEVYRDVPVREHPETDEAGEAPAVKTGSLPRLVSSEGRDSARREAAKSAG